jgi:hypothetical protein
VALRTPYLLFIGDPPDRLAAKTADGVVFRRRDADLVRDEVGAIVDNLPA